MQLGALHAYVDKAFAGVVGVRSYSAFLAIPYRAAGPSLFDFYEQVSDAGEHPYMALFLARYWRELSPARARFRLADLLRQLSLSAAKIECLRRATEAYIDEEIAPGLKRGAVNLIGFTLNYNQVYASAYMARYIQSHYADFNPTFLFGGYSTSVPHVVGLLHRLHVPGCLVIGEGEKKLELIINSLLSKDSTAESVDASVAEAAPGVYPISRNAQVYEPRTGDYATQFSGVAELPVPDYAEYFRSLKAMTDSDETYRLLVAKSAIMVEGSRGCFAKCDFCGLNSTWRGFRKNTPEAIIKQLVELASRHMSTRFSFVDNVCDTWAEKFADLAMASRVRFTTMHELRAHHKEAFWTKLALAGAHEVQIGVEALSQPLLTHMGKGTHVVQNVAVQKFLTELQVSCFGNIITDHPRSTTGDIAETQRILEQCPHLGDFGLSRYRVAPGSPLYNSLSIEERQALKPSITTKLPRSVVGFALEHYCDVPASLTCAPDTTRGWRAFTRWFHKFRASARGRKAALEVSRLGPDKLLVVDARRARTEHHVLEGDECVVYDACHAGPKQRTLPGIVGLDEKRTMAAIERLLAKQILLRIEDAVLAIALRPRDELIQNLRDRREEPTRIETSSLLQLAGRARLGH